MSSDLVAFLKARLEEAAQTARTLDGASWRSDTDVGDEYNIAVVLDSRYEASIARCGVEGLDDGEIRAEHIARHDPAHVLADVETKRQIIGWHACDARRGRDDERCTSCQEETYWCTTLRLLAVPYAGHEGYRAEWAPAEGAHRG